MTRPLRIQFENAIYHVMCRGNEKRNIYKDDVDRKQFITLLQRSLITYNVNLYCYVMMNNHFHLVAGTPLANLSEFMRHLNITYTSYFNRRHKRVGHLYQGRYKSILIDSDNYMVQLSRYIHLNPVRIENIKNKTDKEKINLLQYNQWSSLKGYCFIQDQEQYIDYAMILESFGGNNEEAREAYWQEICSDIKEQTSFAFPIIGQAILGSEHFISEIKKNFPFKLSREIIGIKRSEEYRNKKQIFKIIEEAFGKGITAIIAGKGFERRVTMDLLYRYGGLKGSEIGKLFNIDYSTVSATRRRLREQCINDSEKKEIMRKLEGKCQV